MKIAAKMNRAWSQMGRENAIICCGAGGGGGVPETGHYFILEHFFKNSLLTKKGIQFYIPIFGIVTNIIIVLYLNIKI